MAADTATAELMTVTESLAGLPEGDDALINFQIAGALAFDLAWSWHQSLKLSLMISIFRIRKVKLRMIKQTLHVHLARILKTSVPASVFRKQGPDKCPDKIHTLRETQRGRSREGEEWNEAVTSQEIAQSHQKQEETRMDPALEPWEGAWSY